MTPVELSRTVLRAVRRAVDEGELKVTVPERAVVTVPGPGGCGDYATNIALQLARPAGQPPRRVAEILRPHLVEVAGVADVVVTGPGFINISLQDAADGAAALVEEILRAGLRYGHSDALAGQVIELRIPYEIRAEVVADAIVRIVAAQGGRVEVEHGEPVNLRPVPAPEDPAPLGPDAARWALLHPAAHDRPRITADHLVQRASNPLFRVRYAYARTRAVTRNAAALGFTADPAAISTALGVDAAAPGSAPFSGEAPPSLTAGSIADDLGPEAAPATTPTLAGSAPRPHVSGAAPVSDEPCLSFTADEVAAGPGPDAAVPGTVPTPADGAPLPYLSGAAPAPDGHSPSSTADEIAAAPGPEAVAPAIGPTPGDGAPHPLTPGATSTAPGLDTPTPDTNPSPTSTLLSTTPSLTTPLLTALSTHPPTLTRAATHRAPDRLARHLVTVADATLAFLPAVLPLGDEKPSAAHRARLALAEAAGAVLAGGLSLLGIDAPDHL
ncbi:ArgS-related anticodon-binding protein NrtL [Streptomyces sp. NPDC001002]